VARLTPGDRARVLDLAHYLYGHRSLIDYPPGDVRGTADALTWRLSRAELEARLAAGKRICFDCSQAAQQLFRWCDLGDPCGLGFRYAGDTGAMLRALPHYSNPRGAGRAALVVYGPGRGEHVSVVIEPGVDPFLWSHGRPGIDLWRLSVQRTFHTPPVTFCNVSGLG
jgi:hypothetical protein